jgi:hypothetical protein
VQSADGVFRGHAAAAPGGFGLDAAQAHEGEAHAVRVLERQRALAEPLLGRLVRHAFLEKPMRPVADRTLGDAKGRLGRLADPDPARRRVLPRKERQDRARAAGLVAVVEMIRRGIIEIDGLLHQAKAERPRVEREIPTGLARDGGHVVESVAHGLGFRDGPGRRLEVREIRPRRPRAKSGNPPLRSGKECAGVTKQHFRNHAISVLLNLNADSVFRVNLLPFTLM